MGSLQPPNTGITNSLPKSMEHFLVPERIFKNQLNARLTQLWLRAFCTKTRRIHPGQQNNFVLSIPCAKEYF